MKLTLDIYVVIALGVIGFSVYEITTRHLLADGSFLDRLWAAVRQSATTAASHAFGFLGAIGLIASEYANDAASDIAWLVGGVASMLGDPDIKSQLLAIIPSSAVPMRDARAMFEGIAEEFTAENVDENTIILGEFIKTLIIELTSDVGGEKTPKQAMELARAFHATVAAQKISADRRRQLEADSRAKLDKAVQAVAGQVADAGHPVDAASVLKMIRSAYGIES